MTSRSYADAGALREKSNKDPSQADTLFAPSVTKAKIVLASRQPREVSLDLIITRFFCSGTSCQTYIDMN